MPLKASGLPQQQQQHACTHVGTHGGQPKKVGLGCSDSSVMGRGWNSCRMSPAFSCAKAEGLGWIWEGLPLRSERTGEEKPAAAPFVSLQRDLEGHSGNPEVNYPVKPRKERCCSGVVGAGVWKTELTSGVWLGCVWRMVDREEVGLGGRDMMCPGVCNSKSAFTGWLTGGLRRRRSSPHCSWREERGERRVNHTQGLSGSPEAGWSRLTTGTSVC